MVAFKGDGEMFNGDEKALMVDREALKGGDDEMLKDEGNALNATKTRYRATAK